MAFKATKNANVVQSNTTTFKATRNAGYSNTYVYKLNRDNKSALDLLTEYNNRINAGAWLSSEDRAKYKSAIDTYTSTGNSLRDVSKYYGTKYTDDEEKSWLDSLSSLNRGYTGINDFYSQFADENQYNLWTQWVRPVDDVDYEKYVQIGKGSGNPVWEHTRKRLFGDSANVNNMVTFAEKNSANALIDAVQGLQGRGSGYKYTNLVNLINKYMTDEEKSRYNYYIGKEDAATAQEYLSYIESELNKRAAGDIYKQVDSTVLEPFFAFASGVQSGIYGLENFVRGVLGEEGVTTSLLQYANYYINENNEGAWKVINDLANTTGNMAPSLVIGAINPTAGAVTMGLSAGGNAYSEMLQQGYSVNQARAYGVMTGASEAVLSKVLGGISKLGGNGSGVFQSIASKVLPKVNNAIGKVAIKLGGNMLDEGLEEGVQTVLEPLFKHAATLGESKLSEVDWEAVAEEALYSALLGGLSAGVLEGPQTISNAVSTNLRTQKAFGSQAQNIVADALEINPNDKMALKAQKTINKGKQVSGLTLDTLLNKTDTEKVRKAVADRLTQIGEKGDVSKLSNVIAKQFAGEDLSISESKLLKNSKAAQRVLNELNPEHIASGQYTSGWAESIGTRRLNADVYSRRPSTKVKAKDGAENTINNVRSVADGVATVELADGKVAKVGLDKGITSDVVFNDPKAENLFRIATDRVGKVDGWTTETANAMIKAYEGSTLDASAFARGWAEAYSIGRNNGGSAQVNNSSWAMLLDNKTRADAYNIGKAMATPKVMTPTTNTYKVSFDSTVDEKSLTKKQKTQVKALDVISKALGVNVVVFDSPMGADGKRMGKNGSYNASTRTVEIDLHAGVDGKGLMMFTAAHELTHHMREVASDKFNAYADAVFEALGENGRELVERRVSSLRKSGRLDGKTDEEIYDLAFEEVVADSAEKMLVDTDALVKLSESLKSKDKTLWEKVKDYIVGLVNKIKKIYASLEPDSQEARMLSEMEDKIENIRKLWVEGVVASAEVSDKVAAELGIEIDAKSESVSPTLMSERTWTESEYVVNRDAMAKKIALALNISERKAKKYIDDVNSIARMIANDRVRLDYQASSFGSAFVSNVEYGGSFDYTTLCKKRRLYTGTFSEIQKRLHDVALTPDEILTVRNMLIEAHKEATCGLCYVEGSRANMGKFAQKFIELYKRDNPDGWTPNMVDVNTPDGVEQMRINHPEAYEQYEYFWNHYGKLKDSDPALFASQQKPKLYEARKEYKGEILTHFKGETTIEKKNLNGGIRMQSFSDFEIIHLIDTMQVIMDMSTVGLAGQAYTKVPEFALAFGNTGLKINLSLIAKGVDKNGKLIFDDREGMPHETAFDIRDKYSKNVGTIIVTFTDDQLMAAMADDRIDYIIPFHRSQWKKGQYGAMGLPKGTKDYTFMQNEKLIKQTYHEYQGRMVKDKATNYMPNEYWDFSKSGKENAEAYLKMCAENNKRPKFYKLLDYDGNGTYTLKKDGSTDGYWKLLIDFKMYDNNGKGSPQTPVVPNFNMEESTKMMEEYKGGHEKYPIAYDVVDKFVEQYNKDKGTKYSDRDSIYLDAVNRGDMETAQRMVDEVANTTMPDSKIRTEDGKLRIVYHGTNTGDFTVFNPDYIGMSSGDDGFFGMGFYFAYSKGEASYYGSSRVIPAYLNLKNPFNFEKELQSYQGKRASGGYAPDAVAVMNFADKFPEIAKNVKIGVVENESDTVKDISLVEFSKAFKDVIENKTFEYREVENEFGEKETVVTADAKTVEYQYDGKKYSYTDYGFQKRFWGTPNELDVAYEYLANSVYEYVDMIPRTRLILDNNREFTAALKDMGYDGTIQSEYGDEAVAFYPNQIKSADPVTYDDEGNVIPLSQRFNAENDDIRYQDRLSLEESFSNRSLLANALLDTVQSDIEYKKLDDYKAVIGYLEAEETKLADLKRKIYDATFGDGDKSKLKELREEARKTEARIDLHDKKLLQLESTTALKNVLERAKKQAYSKALEKGREAMHRNVEGRYKTIERNKIKKIAHELDTLLNKGNKKRNVKIEAQGVVRAALDLSNMYFATDDELIMAGIETIANDRESDAVERYKKLYERLHATDDDVTNNKEDRAELRHEMNEIKKDFAELIERERKRINNTKAKTVYNALIEEYEKLANSPSRHIAQAFDADTLNHIKTLRDNVGENLVSEMTLEQIKDVYKAFKMVKTMVTNSNKLFNENLKESVDALGNSALHEIEKHGHKEKFTKVGKTASEFSWNNLKPVYLMERTGSTTLQKLFQKVLDGESVWAKDMLDAREYIEKQKNEYKYDSWDFKKTYEFSTPSGKTFKLNLEQIMTIYAYSKRGEQAIEHLRTDGFVFDKVVVKKNGIEFELNDKSAYKITDEARIKMIGLLTQDQKAYVDAMQKYLSKTMGAKGNEVSKAMYGIELYGEENYLPIHSEGAYLERAREQAKGDVKLKNKGFTKSTVKHARNAIVLSDFDKLCTEHIAEMSSYHAFTLPLEDFYKVYNYQVDSDDVADKRGVIPALENAYGKGATGAIDQLLTDLNGGARGDSRETIAKKSIALYKKAKVMLSLSVVIQQPSSIIRAQAMIDPKYFVGQKIGDTKRKELWAEMKKYAPVTIIKEMGYFDVGIGKASADWLLDDPTLSEKIDEIASKPAAKADELTWIAIWNAVKRETASKNTSLNTSSVEFLEKAGERFEDVIRHTQVYDSTLARSGNMRSKSALMQMATSFMAEPTTSLNMREAALRSKDARRIARTTAAIYGATLLNAVLVAIPYAMRDDDEDETFLEKYITALSTSFVDNLNPITSIPFAKDVWSLMQGYNVDRADMSAASDLIDSFKELVQIATKDKEEREQGDIENAIVKLVGTLSSFSGLPIDNVRRDVMSVFNTYKTLTRGYDTTWKSMEDALQRDFQKSTPVWNLFKTESKNEKLYEAILANDDKYVDRFKSTYEDEDEYNSALRKAIRDNDPRLEEAALARLNGDRDTYYRLMMDVIDEGNFDKQIIKDAFDAEYNYQKRKAEENK